MKKNEAIPIGNAVNLNDMHLLKGFIKFMCEQNNITIKEFTNIIGMNETSYHDRFKRKTITVSDLNKILAPFELKLKVVDMDDEEAANNPYKIKNTPQEKWDVL